MVSKVNLPTTDDSQARSHLWSWWDLKTPGHWSMTAIYSVEAWPVYILHENKKKKKGAAAVVFR